MANQPSPPAPKNPLTGYIRVPYWLFAAIVLAAAGMRVAGAFIDGLPSCP